MGRYAVIGPNGRVNNVIEWDGVEPWTPPERHTVAEDTLGYVDMGWQYEGGTFKAPPELTTGEILPGEGEPEATPKAPVATPQKGKKK